MENTNVLLYGNCQIGALSKTLNIKNFKFNNVLCWVTDISEEDFLKEIKLANIIITQPINDNYREKTYLSTKFIIDNCNENSIVIIFPSIQLDFYYFDKTYKTYDNELLRNPSDYHYKGIIETYKNGETVEYFIDKYYNNTELLSKEELLNISNKSIDELKRREQLMNEYKTKDNIYIIKIDDYIEVNYLNKLLFWTFNHPTKFIFHDISEKIIKLLNFKLNSNYTFEKNINYEIDELKNNEQCLLYKCLQNIVNFDLSLYRPKLKKYDETNVNNIVNYYLETYKNLELKSDLL